MTDLLLPAQAQEAFLPSWTILKIPKASKSLPIHAKPVPLDRHPIQGLWFIQAGWPLHEPGSAWCGWCWCSCCILASRASPDTQPAEPPLNKHGFPLARLTPQHNLPTSLTWNIWTLNYSKSTRSVDYANIARVRNCPDVTILNSLFVFGLFVFLHFCIFAFLSFCLFCLFLSFCLFVFLSFCLDITVIKRLKGLLYQKSLFVSKF